MFKVLVIAYYFPPMGFSGVQRTLKMCKYAGDFNWKPTVITASETGYYAHDNSLMKDAEKTNIEIIRTAGKDINSLLSKFGTIKMPGEFLRKTFSLISKSFFIPDNKKSWAKQAYEAAREVLTKEKFDIIFITVPPFSSFKYCAKLKKEFNTPLFVDYRDLWTKNQFAFYPTPYHKLRHKKMEESLLRLADKVLVTNRNAKESMIKSFPFLDFEDITIVNHGFDPEDFENVVSQKTNPAKMILTYSGIFYEKITPKYFLRAFKKLITERPDVAAKIELHFVGDLRKHNQKLVKKLELQEYVHEHGYMEHSEVIKKLVSSDVLWMMYGKLKDAEAVSPGKLYEYFGSGKPIIASVIDGAAKKSAEEYGSAIITPPDDIDAIKEAILKMFDDFTKGTLPKPKEDAIIKFNRRNITELLIKEFQFFLKVDI